jgi:ABC-2 type transport system ATP-binding protein
MRNALREEKLMDIFSCKAVNKRLGKFSLSDISFSLEPGYILGLIGVNGCGKTTLIKTLTGIFMPDAADKFGSDVSISGISLLEQEKEYKERIAFIFNESLYDLVNLTSKEIGMLYGRHYPGFDMGKYMGLLEKFGIKPKQNISRLSMGQRIRQQLAFALSYDAKVYFFDEPTGNLDVEFREEFYGYMRELVADGDKSIIYATHLVEELEELADYILWLEKDDEEDDNSVSTVKYMGSIDDLKSKYRMVEAEEKVISAIPKEHIVGGRKRENHREFLVDASASYPDCPAVVKENWRYASLKEIMYYILTEEDRDD